jgi:hypothetical protein
MFRTSEASLCGYGGGVAASLGCARHSQWERAPPVRVASRITTTSRRATVFGDSDDVDVDDNGNFGSDAHAHAASKPARSSDTVNRDRVFVLSFAAARPMLV